jgi:hypothetical protein
VAKSSNATVMQRIEELLSLRLAGAGFVEIRQYASEKGWGVSGRQLRRYIGKSDTLPAASLETNRPKLMALHLAQRRLLLNKSMEVGDYGTALRVLQDSAKLQDLYPTKEQPLDALLKHLPAGLAAATREALGSLLPGGPGTPGGGAAAPDLGGDPPGPGEPAGAGEFSARQMAGRIVEGGPCEDPPLFASGGEKPDGGGPGHQDGVA